MQKYQKHSNKWSTGGFGDAWTFVGVFAPSGEAEAELGQGLMQSSLQKVVGKGCLHGYFQHFCKSPHSRCCSEALCWAPALRLPVCSVPCAQKGAQGWCRAGCGTSIPSQRLSPGCSSTEISPCRVRATRAWPQMKVEWLQLKKLSSLLPLMPLIYFIYLFIFRGSLCHLLQWIKPGVVVKESCTLLSWINNISPRGKRGNTRSPSMPRAQPE